MTYILPFGEMNVVLPTLAGFKGNRFHYWIYFFSWGLKQMEVFKRETTMETQRKTTILCGSPKKRDSRKGFGGAFCGFRHLFFPWSLFGMFF